MSQAMRNHLALSLVRLREMALFEFFNGEEPPADPQEREAMAKRGRWELRKEEMAEVFLWDDTEAFRLELIIEEGRSVWRVRFPYDDL